VTDFEDVAAIQSNAAIGRYLTAHGVECEVLTTSAFDEPVWLAQLGGQRLPAILITAGSHADEVAGVFAALSLARTLHTDHRVYLVPCRDPVGWNGFAHTLHRLDPAAGDIETYAQACAALRASEVLFDDEGQLIARVAGHVFATQPTPTWTSTEITRHRLPVLLARQPGLAAQLQDTRVTVPGNVAVEDGRTPYSYGGHTAYVGRGFSAQFNRFFDRPDAPPEVSALRSLADRIKPGLTLDLHEGFSGSFYLFIDPEARLSTRELATSMVDAVRDAGGQIAHRHELEPIWGPAVSASIGTIGQGVFSHGAPSANERATLAAYCEAFGSAVTTEPGMAADVAHRVKMIEVSVRAAIARFEQHA
jgi:hypothetical protein